MWSSCLPLSERQLQAVPWQAQGLLHAICSLHQQLPSLIAAKQLPAAPTVVGGQQLGCGHHTQHTGKHANGVQQCQRMSAQPQQHQQQQQQRKAPFAARGQLWSSGPWRSQLRHAWEQRSCLSAGLQGQWPPRSSPWQLQQQQHLSYSSMSSGHAHYHAQHSGMWPQHPGDRRHECHTEALLAGAQHQHLHPPPSSWSHDWLWCVKLAWSTRNGAQRGRVNPCSVRKPVTWVSCVRRVQDGELANLRLLLAAV